MKIYEKLSLKYKLIGMVVVVAMLMIGGGLLSMYRMGDDYAEEVEKSFSSLASTTVHQIEGQFFERYGDVQAFSVNGSVRSMVGSTIQEDLDRLVPIYGIYELILVVDANGRYVGSSTKDTKGRAIDLTELKRFDFSTTPWFKAAHRGEFTDDESNGLVGTYFEQPHVDPLMKLAFGESRIGTGFTTTIKDRSNRVVGIITTRANTSWYESILTQTHEALLHSGVKDAGISLIGPKGFAFSEVLSVDGKSVLDSGVDKFLKVNYSAHEGAKKALAGESGALNATDPSDGEVDVVGFQGFGGSKWVKSVSWGLIIHDAHDDAMRAVIRSKMEFATLMGVSAILAILFALFFSLALSKRVASLASILGSNSSDLSSASGRVAASASQLSAGSTEQAAALQQTVAAVDEISAMVDKNAESANRSKEASAHSRDAALRGRQNVDTMIRAIDDISHSNEEVSNQMAESNARLAEITKLINDIGSKTKVINEIVFQTKLLSFNASVEAARAGEYGKGFAVVAEEVGNLAQMSGNAAKEITTLLEESVRKVEGIVSESRTRVERLVSDSKTKVSAGAETARSCNEALDEILTQVSSVDVLVSEIAVASQEQSTGIREIAKAVGQMEEVTQQNSSVAEDSSAAAEQLNAQSTQLKEVVSTLLEIVHGVQAEGVHHQDPAAQKTSARKSSVLTFKASPKRGPKNELRASSEPLARASGEDLPPSSDDPGFGE